MTEIPRIAVVGGGPAGSTCARALASAGAPVDLFEASVSSEKPCGGGVPSAALREFPELADPSLPRRIVREVVIHAPSGRRVSVGLDGGIHIFERHTLDSFLRRRAVESGARLCATRVRSVRPAAGDRWELLTEEGPAGPYEHLVGADGVHGVVRRALAGRYDDEQLTLALYAYVPGVPRGEMVLKFFGDFDGYLWVFPRTDHVSVGICAKHRRVEPARLAGELRRFLERNYPETRLAPPEVRGYFIPSSRESAGATRHTGGGWALAGDAAGHVDPLTREGIAWAMRSGLEVARGMIRRGELRTPPLPADLTWAHRYGPGFYRREFLESMSRLASASSAIRAVLSDLFTGNQPYAQLRRRLLLSALPCGLEVGLRSVLSIFS